MPLPTIRLPARRALLLAGLSLATAGAPAHAGLPEVVAAARPAVVAIGVFDPLANPRFNFRGTGFAVGDGRLVATNAHVLPDDALALERLALLPAGAPRTGTETQLPVRKLAVVAIDRLHDVALLRLEGPPLPTLALATGLAREGQAVALIGFPLGGLLGFSPVTHRGIVASIAPFALPPPDAARLDAAAVARLRQTPFDIYQLDANAYPGNSGGPLLDAESGEVLGLMNMVVLKGGRESLLNSPSGISYAIPVSHLRALIDRP